MDNKVDQKVEAKKIKILIVDDEESFRRLLRGILESKFDFEIIEAVDGKKALEKAHAEKPFLIILDIMMPEMDGLQFLQEIRKSQELSDLPVIICSAINERSKVVDLFNQRIVDYIVKPIKPIIFVNKIKTYLAEYLSKITKKE
jgi:two-component system alkaline phosphatase synthesis response regulator PhoP